MHPKKHLSFKALIKAISSQLCQIEDPRQKGKVFYSLHDCVMSAFAMMYLQDPSLLAFQRRIQDRIQKNNVNTIFGVHDIPKDSQLRNVLDALSPEALSPIFTQFLSSLQRGKHLATYSLLGGKYLIPIDGSEYFSSEKIHCPHCLYKKQKKASYVILTKFYKQPLYILISAMSYRFHRNRSKIAMARTSRIVKSTPLNV